MPRHSVADKVIRNGDFQHLAPLLVAIVENLNISDHSHKIGGAEMGFSAPVIPRRYRPCFKVKYDGSRFEYNHSTQGSISTTASYPLHNGQKKLKKSQAVSRKNSPGKREKSIIITLFLRKHGDWQR